MSLPNNILLIDDDKINNFLNEKLLRKVGTFDKISIFLDGESALHHLQREAAKGNDSPELIFVDINMPIMNGIEFLENYHHIEFKNREKVTLIGLTTSLRPSDLEKLKELHCKLVLNKPLTKSSLHLLISELFTSEEKAA